MNQLFVPYAEQMTFTDTGGYTISNSSPKVEAFDRELTPIGALDRFNSLQWVERPSRAGWFELWCPLDPENVEMLRTDNIIWQGDDSAMFVESIKPELTKEHGLQMQVRGRSIEGYADFRIVWGLFTKYGTVSEVARELVRTSAVNPANINRIIPMLTLLENQQTLGDIIDYQKTGNSLHDALQEVCDTHNLGWSILFDPFIKNLTFAVIPSVDRTYGNEQGNDPVVFDSTTEDILESTYFYNKKDHKNVALVAGAGEGAARKTITINDSIGLDRREIYIDARDLSDVDQNMVSIPISTYNAMLTQRGYEKLAEWPVVESYEAKLRVDQMAQHRYGIDYRKGDWVTIWDKALNVQINAKVTEMEKVHNNDGFGLNLTFGFTQPTLANMIKRLK